MLRLHVRQERAADLVAETRRFTTRRFRVRRRSVAQREPSWEQHVGAVDELAALIARAGVGPFVAAPLLEPNDRYFPDEWHGDESSLARLAKRFLEYAGLGSYDAVVECSDDAETNPGAAVWLVGVDGETCRFSTALDRLDDPLIVVATVAYEVARAYRTIHDLDGSQEPSAAVLAVTTIYLGFGIVTTNASYRYRASGELLGQIATTTWSHTQFGGLSPETMSFLLAAQLAARDATSRQIRSVVAELETNQRSYFEAAYRELMPAAVAERLQLPDRATWPAARPLPPERKVEHARSLLGALRQRAEAVPTATVVRGGRPRTNAVRATFRVIGTAATLGFALGLLIAVALFVATAVVMSRLVEGPPLASFPVGALLGMVIAPPVVGFVLGKRRRRDHCSDPDCNALLPQVARTCPGCGGTIAATLKHRNERLDAEERLQLNRDENDIDVGSASSELAPGARALFTPIGVAGGLIAADVHQPTDGASDHGDEP